jgi:hypothetical protein
MRNFYGSIVFTIVALILAGTLGYTESGLLLVALASVAQAALLGVMETSLSLDNAVVNASILKNMAPVWRTRFLTWGVLVAVFGMRLLFPVVIVSIAGHVGLVEAARIAVTQHDLYERIITGAHVGIAGFGGAFLMLIGTHFFVDDDREHLWMPMLEKPLAALARIPFAPYAITVLTVGLLSLAMPWGEARTFLVAAAAGLGSYVAVQLLGKLVGDEDELAGKVATGGVMAFVQLELIDASFSFDGVIGAFAITNDILLIALGLGIGAMFVRSMTVALVKGGTLNEYRYLEPGAFYAIQALALVMLFGPIAETPEVVTGLLGAGFIGAALWSSVRHKRLFPEEYAEEGQADAITATGDVVPGVRTAA